MAETSSAKQRRPNWSDEERVFLIEAVNIRAERLFGKMKGSGAVKGGRVKELAWEAVTAAINAKSTTVKRTVDEAKKQFANIKQRAKEKADAIRRPKTGGGPRPPSPTLPESKLLEDMAERNQPTLQGLMNGFDSEDVQPTESQVVPSSISDTHVSVHEPPAEPQPSTSSELNCIVLQDGILKTSLTPGPCLSSNSSKKRKLLDEEQETLRAERLKYVAETEMLKAQTNYYEMKTALVKAQLHRLEQ